MEWNRWSLNWYKQICYTRQSCSLEHNGTRGRAWGRFIIQVNTPIYMQIERQLRHHNFHTSVWYSHQLIVLKELIVRTKHHWSNLCYRESFNSLSLVPFAISQGWRTGWVIIPTLHFKLLPPGRFTKRKNRVKRKGRNLIFPPEAPHIPAHTPQVMLQRSGSECASPTSEAKQDPVSHFLQHHFCAGVF